MSKKVKISRVFSGFTDGLSGAIAEIEVSIIPGIPTFDIIGPSDSSVRESGRRIRSAIRNGGFSLPNGHITVNISPSHIRKTGSVFDLPIAIGILFASGCICADSDKRIYAEGELSLSGEVRETPGAYARLEAAARDRFDICIVPGSELPVSALAGLCCTGVAALEDAVRTASGKNVCAGSCSEAASPEYSEEGPDFSLLKGQEKTSRALILAAAGMHNILLIGSPGSGKSTAAKILGGILPPLNSSELRDVLSIRSAAGIMSDSGRVLLNRPFRHVSRTITLRGLLGSPDRMLPGEISLANHGVLFFDEICEFSPAITDALRQPLEDRNIRLVRNGTVSTFPASFIFAAASNPCRCGLRLLESPSKCSCTAASVRSYMSRISGPLCDRIDIFSEMHSVNKTALKESVSGGSKKINASIRDFVGEMWNIQYERYSEYGLSSEHNGTVKFECLAEIFRADRSVVDRAANLSGSVNGSVRGFRRLLRVGRTIADVSGRKDMCVDDISEAVMYKRRTYV